MPEEQYMHKDIQDIHSKDGRAPVRDFGQFPGQAVLELDNVSRSFNKGAVQAVRDVSFKLQAKRLQLKCAPLCLTPHQGRYMLPG